MNRRLRHAEGIASSCAALGRLLVDMGSSDGPVMLAESADRAALLGQTKRAKKLKKAAEKGTKRLAQRD